ncbi:NADP-dependent oxidoreductase [Lentzea sp. NPDC059081]|uniref:NADP-dependent oxidoreductase n=1 Tax=Lentzea sp. NPDC059081 TaxID=3346719 RepID=UPI0036745710
MRAVVQRELGGPEVLVLDEVPRPVPVPTEVLVRVRAAGINPVDWKTRTGGGMAGVLGAPPFTLGWDVSGVVEEVGYGVTTLAPGDEVFGMPWFPRAASAYAEYVTAPARQFARKPASISHEEAAALPLAALTAWQALTAAARVEKGQRVLVHAAAGGVGHLAVQFAKHLGAHVIGTASAAKHDWLRELGADEVIDYRSTRFEDVTGDVDVVLDALGEHDDTALRSVGVLKPGGVMVCFSGFPPHAAAAATDAGVRLTPFLVEPDGAALATIAGLVEAGEVTVRVDEVFPLDQVAQAHATSEANATSGKLVLRVAG